ncbi:alpha/beta hydrolase [Streptomyces sp. NPDC020403]|uniref:alpha/beta hydrolase family protein n=1 Tax=unclassified Streptomyces TaxID=2593676 RepID=UPI00340E07A5
MTIGHRRRTAVATLAAGLLLATPATAAHALPATAPATSANSTTAPTLELPRPTGPYAVGTDVLHLTDRARTDPWVPDAGHREVMVSVHYPARPGGTGASTPYISTKEAEALLWGLGLDDDAPAELSSIATHARTGATAARGRFPLLLLSPGFGNPRATLTSLAEDLASRGYVVASIDHAYESSGTAFPGGRILRCAACDAVEAAPDEAAKQEVAKAVSTGRAADLSFVLDRLTGSRPAWGNARMIDRRRVAAAGHSIGGSAAVSTMLTDPRIDAGINMDGTFFDPIPRSGTGDRPFLMLGTEADHPAGGKDVSWEQSWNRLDGWKRWLTVRGSHHSSFTDIPVFAERIGLPIDPAATLSPERSTGITRDYVAAFLDLHLKNRPQPLLDGPSPDNPEVVFQHH